MSITLDQIDEAIKEQPNEFGKLLDSVSLIQSLASGMVVDFYTMRSKLPESEQTQFALSAQNLKQINELAESLAYAVAKAKATQSNGV